MRRSTRVRRAGASPAGGAGRFWLSCVLCLLLCLPSPAFAGEDHISPVPNNYWSFMAGALSGIALHELGHVVVATTEGYDIHHDGPSITYSPPFRSKSDRLHVSTAGFQSQWLVTEGAFYLRDKAPDFTGGLIAAHLGITAVYLFGLKNNSQSDITSASIATGLSRTSVMLLALPPAILDGWRFLGNDPPSWLAPVSIGYKAGMITGIWVF
ncbi:hypothetical protein [Geomonas sp.]|uniref:hypothetical protein n=1 Tax=Geomonas sp. TaxID=2651584 RepID=UPI002B4A32DC|nr:hypothetical protein [Geomonas sp.]HJV33999.1 hypothetical protein [Geomonas sp.]